MSPGLLLGLLMLLSLAKTVFPNASVMNGGDLIRALMDNAVTSIQLSADIKFGPEFSLLPSPLQIHRNVTISSPVGQLFALNLAHYVGILTLGDGVALELVNVDLSRYRRIPLSPGKFNAVPFNLNWLVLSVTH